MYHLRRIKVLLATCLLACTSLWAQDVKVPISSATSTSVHTGEGADKAIDGDYSTFWHSDWNNIPKFPVDFVIILKEVSHVDYVRYTPRLSGTNGNWKKVEVSYFPSTSGADFTSPVEYDLKGASSTFDFPIGANCGQIKFTIYPGETDNGKNLASAAEIAAYAYDTAKPAAFAQYFNGDVYSELKPGVTSSDGIADADVKALVEAMLTDAAEYKKFRVGEYEPYMTTATVRNNLKTNSLYNNYENPTGIYLKRGESCIVAVSGINASYPVGLKIKDWYKSGDLSTYKLHNGLNYITATTEGNVFVDYYTDDFEIAPNVQMHFINAPVLGYWDQATMTNADWESMLAGPLTEDDEIIIITRSEHAQTAYPVKQWKTYCSANVNETMTYYQQVQWAERDIMGLEMFGRQVKNRQLFYADKSGSMFAGGDASVCGYGDLKPLVTPDAKVFDFWGVGHEWGHNNQMAGFHWTGCGETTNNIPASWAQFKFTGNRDANGNPTNLRLEDEVTGINDYIGMRGGRMQTYFEEGLRKGVQWQLQDGPDWHAETPTAVTVTGRDENGNDKGQVNTTWRHYDHFVKLAPFWQLNLWGTVAEKNAYIITKVIEAIRSTDNYTSTYNTNGKQQINWMKLACQAAEMDLLPFFEKAGMLRPIHAYVDDYTKGWNIITEEMINELKASVAAEVAAGRYQAYPDEEINYINGHNYHIYRDKLELNVTSMEGERNGDKVTIQHSVAQNAVAFETYNAQDELIRITMYGLGSDDTHSYTQVLFPSSFDESENAAYIMAVGYDGERQRVYQTYANEDEAKYGELGRILAGVEAMKALCNDTKVGYYKSSALTDLNAAYTTAKRVYDNKESASYAAIYDMLNAEYGKVLNDEYARVGIVEGNAYRLQNKQYATRYMSVVWDSEESVYKMWGEEAEVNENQKWYFETAETEGCYYLRNKTTSTYPGDVVRSGKLNVDKTKDEAQAYMLKDMGNGLWALVGSLGLHCGAWNYDYKVLGWDADADASQWYITAVEISSNAEALHDLRSLIAKTEALIAEVEGDAAYNSISTALSQTKSQVTTAKAALEAGNSSAMTGLNEAYEALLAAKKNVDDSVLDVLKNQLSTLIGNANSLIAQCGAVTYTPATPDTELALQANYPANSWYVSSNADENTGGGKVDGGGIAALVDNNYNTYFHTRWDGTEVNEPHNIQVDMGEGKTIQEFVFSYTPRNGSPAPTAMTIYGSNDASSFTDVLATITSGLPAHNSGNSYTSSAINSGGATYRYLRFVVTKSAGPAANTQYGGQYFFGMMEFDITEMAKPESYDVNLGAAAGDVTEDMLLAIYKQNQEAQATINYAATESQVQKAIDKLQAQYDALYEAKNVVQYVDFTISSNVSGGGVKYNEIVYISTQTLNAPSTLTENDLTAIECDGYTEGVVSLNGTTINVTYKKRYKVVVVGVDAANGGVTSGEATYKGGDTFEMLESVFNIEDFNVIDLQGYEEYKTFENAIITITYNRVYTVQVTGGRGNGGITYGGKDYADGTTFDAEQGSFSVNDLTVIVPDGYTLKETITLNHETGVINVVFSAIPLVDTEKYYTLECKSSEDHRTERFIGDNGSVIDGRSAEGARFLFERANDENGYYMKSMISGKYLNHDANNNLYASADRVTVWTIVKTLFESLNYPFTLTVGNNLYLNNYLTTDCTDGSCVDLRSNLHNEGVGSGNACSLWTLVEYDEPYDKTELNTLLGEVKGLVASCYTNEVFNYTGSIYVTEALMTATDEKVSAAQTAYDDKTTAKVVYDAALEALQTAKTNLQYAIECALFPVVLTVDPASPELYIIKTKRDGDNWVLQYDEPTELFSVTTVVEKEPTQAFYFMKGDGSQVYIYPFMAGGKLLAANEVGNASGTAFAMEKGSATYEQWVFVARADGYYNLQPAGTSTYLSNIYGTSHKMGFYGSSPDTDKGSLFKFEPTTVEGSYYYLKLKDYYENQVKVASSGIQGGTAVGCYPEAAAEAYNTAYRNAANVLENATATDEEYTNAYHALKAANEALNLIMPEVGKYYRFVSVVKKNDETNSYANVYANPADNKMYWAADKATGDATAMWTFVPLADGKFAVTNLHTGSSINTFINYNPSPLGETAGEVSIVSLSLDGQIGIKCGDRMMHAQGGGAVVHWETGADDGSAWRIVEVDVNAVMHTATLKYEHAGLFLNYAVEKPEGVKAYYIDGTKEINIVDGVGELKLTELEGDVIPARTAVILYAPEIGNDAKTYDFYYTADDSEIDNLLTGSAFTQYLAAEADHAYYNFGQKEGQVGLYKNSVKYVYDDEQSAYVEAAEDATHYKVSANKVLFDWDASSQGVTSFRFRMGDEETGIEGITIDADATIYDLYGRRVLEVVTPGLYIVNGEKRYVKVK